MNPLLVVKFGGACLDTPEHSSEAADTVRRLAEETHPIVVVSAPGRAGSPYATDTLLSLADHAELSDDLAERDALIACGEIISAALFALRLQGAGLDARSLTGAQAGITTDGSWGSARITGVDPAPIRALSAQGAVPVVAGFQGAYGERTATLGRGGSDLTAVALGAALQAPVLILSDVDGVYTADPRIIEQARRLPAMSYEDVAQLTYRGAKVVHPRAAEMAMAHGVDVTVARPAAPRDGTRVVSTGEAERMRREVSESTVIGGVTSQTGRVQFQVEIEGDRAAEETDRLFGDLAGEGISLDMIHVNGRRVMFTVDGPDRAGATRVMETLGLGSTTVDPCAKVSIIGGGMHGRPGVMARMVHALYEEGIGILQSVDSYNVISCLVLGDAEERAVQALHRAFFEADGR